MAKNFANEIFKGSNAITTLKLTAAGAITLITDTFYGYTNSANCTLYLNTDKQSGSGTPKPSGLTWGGVTWKAIQYQ